MGLFDGKHFTGTVGQVIFRKRKGKQIVCARPLPGTMKQTGNTKKASGTFGMASLLTSNIRQGFCNLHDGDIHSRLMSALNPVLSQCRDLETMKYSFDAGSFNQLQGLEFNVDLPLRKQSGYLPGINLEKNRLQVHFPTEKMVKRIKFIKGSSYCTITASLLLFALKDGLRSKAVQQKLKLGKSDTGSSGRITFDCFVPDGCLCLLGDISSVS